MTIYDYLEICNGVEDMVFTLFDVNIQELIYVSTDDGEKIELTYDELRWSDYSDYEICSFDIWYDEKNKCIHIEFNVEEEEE